MAQMESQEHRRLQRRYYCRRTSLDPENYTVVLGEGARVVALRGEQVALSPEGAKRCRRTCRREVALLRSERLPCS